MSVPSCIPMWNWCLRSWIFLLYLTSLNLVSNLPDNTSYWAFSSLPISKFFFFFFYRAFVLSAFNSIIRLLICLLHLTKSISSNCSCITVDILLHRIKFQDSKGTEVPCASGGFFNEKKYYYWCFTNQLRHGGSGKWCEFPKSKRLT